MSEKYDPNYDGSNEITPQKEEANNWHEENHNSHDDDDDEEIVTQQEQNRRRKYGYFYEQPWLNDEDLF